MRLIAIPLAAAALALCAAPAAGGVTLDYQGAFRVPPGSFPGDPGNVDGRETWAYGGRGLAFYPGGAGGGSLYGSCHAQIGWLGEMSIPAPVISPTKTLGDLNTATQLQNFYPGGATGVLGLEYLPAQGSQLTGKLYAVSGAGNSGSAQILSWCELDLSNPQVQGPWNPANLDSRLGEELAMEIPSAWAGTHVGGRALAIGGHWGLWGRGPALWATAPWLETTQPPPAGDMPGTVLLRYDASNTMQDYHPEDEWKCGAWLELGGDQAAIFAGRKATTVGTVTTYAATILFYDPDDLAQVASGAWETYDPQPYAVLDMESLMFGAGHALLGMAYDRQGNVVYIAEDYGDGSAPLIHAWNVVPEPLTGCVLLAGAAVALLCRRRR